MMKKSLIMCCLLLLSLRVLAGEAEIVFAKFQQKEAGWKVDVTLKHNDEGWNHYANAWRIVDDKGTVLGKRVLAHPHTEEQPFTRSLRSTKIPEATTVVYIEASDLVHGWSKQRLRVDLKSDSGDRYTVKR